MPINLGLADKIKVKALAQRLISALFAEPERVVDSLMAANHFMKRVVLFLEKQLDDKDAFLRQTVIETLAMSLGVNIKVIKGGAADVEDGE